METIFFHDGSALNMALITRNEGLTGEGEAPREVIDEEGDAGRERNDVKR